MHIAALACTWLLLARPAHAADFSVTPIRAELKPGNMSETVTITNDANARLRVGVKLVEWTQDANGQDTFKDSGDLIYFPRQLDIEPGARRLVRIGAKDPGKGVERAYRLYIEEQPDPNATAGATVSFFFRFALPVFVPPPGAKPGLEPGPLDLSKGKLSIPVRNSGTQHLRISKLVVSNGAGWQTEVAGWYTLPGATRTYTAEVPVDVCRTSRMLQVRAEGESAAFERQLEVDPARCS